MPPSGSPNVNFCKKKLSFVAKIFFGGRGVAFSRHLRYNFSIMGWLQNFYFPQYSIIQPNTKILSSILSPCQPL
ncbi:hypothetical protein AP285_09865 [Limnospira platensis YZ]|nr:hypothetical protein AP285_09865 [Arthrospira platensis YZ]KDR56862.1 hypothetical protein APPUASWS_014625 [Arthrospira platensis str. Paraca]